MNTTRVPEVRRRVLSYDAVRLLTAHGGQAARADGMLGCRLAQLRVDVPPAPA